MTNYVTSAVAGPVYGPMLSKDKGDFSNRVQCTGAQIGNTIQTAAQDAVVIGGMVAGGKAIQKSKGFTNALDKMFNTALKPFKNNPRMRVAVNEFKAKVLPKLKSLSAPQLRAAAVVGGLGALALGYIHNKHIYKMGQIDQKYTDKAKIENHSAKNVL